VLEPCAGKLACTVLRGLGPSNGAWLLGTGLAPMAGELLFRATTEHVTLLHSEPDYRGLNFLFSNIADFKGIYAG
jgi:hypothetical protein